MSIKKSSITKKYLDIVRIISDIRNSSNLPRGHSGSLTMHTPKHILTFLSIFLFSNLAFSQVVIKDTVVITPKGGGKSSPLSISNPQYYTVTANNYSFM